MTEQAQTDPARCNGRVVLTWEKTGRGRPVVKALCDGEVVLLERLDLADPKQRAKFARRLHQKAKIAPAQTERELVRFASEWIDSHNSDAETDARQAPDAPELDAREIVRPERFILPELSGLSVPAMVPAGDQVIGQWWCYLRWRDGRRERRVLKSTIEGPDGRRLWVYPKPADATPNMRPGWSAEARRRWLEGEPAPSAAEVFRQVCERVAWFVDLPASNAAGIGATVGLWALLSYVYHAWPAVPYLYVGGTLGSGKSRLFEVLSRLVFRPFGSSSLSPAAMFRTLHAGGGVLLLDEAERLRDTRDPGMGELLAMLLAGYKAGGTAARLEPVGEKGFHTVLFQVFGPKALACIAGLPPALVSRCIPIAMIRAAPDSPKPRRRIDAHPERWQSIRDALHALALEHGPTWLELAARADVCPAGLSGRDYELWQPLLALAAFVEQEGADGLLRLVQEHALEVIEGARDEQIPERDQTLLKALADAVRSGERPTPGELLERAKTSEPDGFGRWTPRAVSEYLKRYGLTTCKTDGRKRYSRVSLADLERVQISYGVDLGIDADTTP